MNETTMPAAEAAVDTTDEVVSYELAFHVLPTVAEGEVATVESAIAALITDAGGTIGVSEKAQRFDLAYELTKHIDGKYRHFATAYFGWMRFTAAPAAVADILSEVEAKPEILRALITRLTRQEEEHPFFLHEALASRKQVVDVDAEAPAPTTEEDNDTTESTDEEDSEIKEAPATDTEETTADASTESTDATEADDESK